MSKIKLDLKQFKHISSDDKSTILRHKDGHLLTISHKALSPEGQSQLQALSKISKDSATPLQHDESKADSLSEGGEVKPPATVHTDSTIKGLKDLEAIKKEGKPEFGGTVVVHPKKRKMYADPQGPVSADDSAPTVPEALQPTPESSEAVPTPAASEAPPQQVDPTLQSKRQLYNQVVTASTSPDQQRGTGAEHSMFGPNGEAPKNFNSQAWQTAEQFYKEQEDAKQKQVADQANHAVQENAARQAAGLPPIPVPTVQSDASGQMQGQVDTNRQPQSAATQGAGQQTAAPSDAVLQDPATMVSTGLQKQQEGITAEAKAVGDLGQQQAELLDKQQKAQQLALDAYKTQFDGLNQERQAAIQDVKDGFVSPNHYWTGDPKTGEGSHSKIMTGIGIILAGFNPTNNPNAAIGFLKHQMEMNLTAQAHNLDAKNNLLAHNLRQFGNLKDAADFTRIQQNDMLSHQLESAAATAKTPMAAAAAKQASGKLQMDAASMMQEFSFRRAFMNLANQTNGGSSNPDITAQMINYARVVKPELAKDLESRFVPHVGLAQVQIPQQAREELTNRQKLTDAGQDLLKYSQTHTNIVPGTPEYTYGVTKAMAFQQMVREGLLGTVFRESETPLLNKFVKENPAGALKAFSTQPQLRAILESNINSLNSLKSSYGLPQAPQQSISQPQIKTDSKGVKWMRGPHGEAIRVK